MTQTWVNYGDENGLEHGGIWIKKDNDTPNAYYIVKNVLVDDNPENQVVLDLYVETKESWINKKAVLSYIGMDEETYKDTLFAIGLTDYYSFDNFGSRLKTGSSERTRQELKEHGILV